jgi:hypothetical protein
MKLSLLAVIVGGIAVSPVFGGPIVQTITSGTLSNYLASTTPISASSLSPDGLSVSDGLLTVSFDDSMVELNSPGGAMWGVLPSITQYSSGMVPILADNDFAPSYMLTLSGPAVTMFGFEASPDFWSDGRSISVEFCTVSGTCTTDTHAFTRSFESYIFAATANSIDPLKTIQVSESSREEDSISDPMVAGIRYAADTAVPEPTSILLLGAGLALFGTLRLKNRRSNVS